MIETFTAFFDFAVVIEENSAWLIYQSREEESQRL
jgi:hypothetical protein